MKKVLLMLLVVMSAGLLGAQMRPGTLIELNNLMALPIADQAAKHAGNNGYLFYYGQNRPVIIYQSFDGHETYKYDTNLVEKQLVNEYHNWSDYTGNGSSVYVLWNYAPTPHVPLSQCKLSRFDKDGQYRETVRVEGEYYSCHNIALADSNTLVMAATGLDRMPFVGLFQTNGQLIRRLNLTDDLHMTADKKKRLAPLEFNDAYTLDLYEQMSLMDSDGDGNVMLVRRYLEQQDESPLPTVVFYIHPDGTSNRSILEAPHTKFGHTFLIRAFHNRIVTIGTERNDASEVAKCVLRVYDNHGKLLQDKHLPIQFGFALLDWNEHRALFATQAGNPRAQVRHLGIIEALPE